MITRRKLFLASGVSAAAAIAAARAAAFQQVEIGGPLAERYAAACSGTDRHSRLVARLKAVVDEAGLALSSEEIAAAIATVPCPLCGCALDASAPVERGRDDAS